MIKKTSKERINRLFEMRYGIFRYKKLALVKTTSYKVMLLNLGWSIIDLPIIIVQWFFEVLIHILDLIPRIYIEEKTVNAKTYSNSGHFDIDENYVTSQYCPICNTYLGDYDYEDIVECPICKAKVDIN